jgi:HK97 family phage major capsid protein
MHMDPVQELNETCRKLGTAFEEFKSENNKLIAKGVRDALAEMKLENLGQAIDDLSGKKEDFEKRIKAADEHTAELERKVNLLSVRGDSEAEQFERKNLESFNVEVKSLARVRGVAEPEDLPVEQYRIYRGAFQKYVRGGEKMLTAEEHKTMLVGADAEGGYFVTPDISGRIVTRIFDLSPIRSIAAVQALSSDRLEGIADKDEAAVGWVGETDARPETGTPKIGKYEIPAHEMYAKPKATQKLLDDAAVDIEAWLSGKVADKMAREEGTQFVIGNGVNKPRGFATYPTAATADATRAWGTLEHVNTGVNGGFHATLPADVLFDVEGAFKPGYLAGASWVTRRSVITAVRKFKGTDNNYLWQPGLAAGRPSTLIGYPVVMAEDIPALASGSLSMALGNFREAYQIVDRLGVRVLRDPYTDKPYVLFYTTKRTGGGVIQFEALKFVRFST